MSKPRGNERTKKIYELLALPEDTLNDKVRKLDKVNDQFVEIRMDLYLLQTKVADKDSSKNPSEAEKEWLQKATFALNKMLEDHTRLEQNRNRLQQAVSIANPDHEILDTCRRLESEAQAYINAMSDPKPVKLTKLERDFPSDVIVSDLGDESAEDVINLFIEEDEEDLMNSLAETEMHKQMYDAFFVAHAKKSLKEEDFAHISEMAETSYEVYLEKHCG